VLTTADEINIIDMVCLHELHNMQPGTPSLACSQNACSDAYACISGFISLLMSYGDDSCHRMRNIGLCLKWDEGGAVGV